MRMKRSDSPAHGPASIRSFWLRPTAKLAAAAAALALAGCGGGVFVGYDGSSDYPPDVNLVASPPAAFQGEPVDLAAAASDDYAVRRVDFFRSDSVGGVEFLGSDYAPPYGLRTALPRTPDGGVSYSARAIDDVGQFTDSAWLVVTVLR
jgi:hypothetical protein